MRRIALVLIACLAISPLAFAQQEGAEPTEAQVLSEKLDEVTALLRELVEAQRTALALRALQSRSATLERLEAREDKLRDRLSERRLARENIAVELETIEDQAARLTPGSAFEESARQNIAKLEATLDSLDGGIAENEAELSELEIEILDAEQGMLRLEEIVAEGLGEL